MKNISILIFAISLTIYLTGCGDNTVTGTGGNQTPTISGKIQNWRLGSGKKVYLIANGGDTSFRSFVLDSCKIDSLGNFTMNLTTPADSMLMLFQFNVMCTHHTIINPAGLRYCYADFAVKDSSNISLGYIFRSNDTLQMPYTGKVISYSYYFNGSGSITGTDTCNYGQPILIEHSEVTQTKGWNSLFIVYDSVTSNVLKVSATTQTHNVQWYFAPIYDRSETQGKLYRRSPYLIKK